jgi:serine/threonine-protein kinase
MSSSEDLRFGRLALSHNFVTPGELTAALREQAERLGRSSAALRIGELLVSRGLLTRRQVKQILAEQSSAGRTRRMLGGYELLGRLGSGGMGTVHKARQVALDRVVALKVLPHSLASDHEFIARFYREARAVARLNHPNIVGGYEVGQDKDYHFLAMEFVDGPSAASLLASSPAGLPEPQLLAIAVQTGRALSHAHQAGIIHRDIKPENILLTADGTAKLCDLGLARSAVADRESSLTQAGVAVGTPYYISPEQARGSQDVDARADIYSFGATLFHLATGRTPFQGDNSMQVMTQHIEVRPPRASDVAPRVSAELSAVIDRMLAKDRSDRYQSAAAVVGDLERVARGERPVHASPCGRQAAPVRRGPQAPTHGKTVNARAVRGSADGRRRARRAAFGALLVAALVCAAGLWHLLHRPAATPPRHKLHPHSSGDAPETPRRAVPADGELANRHALKRFEAWAREHPGDIRGQLRRFQRLARQAGSQSPSGRVAARHAKELRALLDKAIDSRFDTLRSRAAQLMAGGRYGQAAELFRSLPPDFEYAAEPRSRELAAAETVRIREAGLDAWRRVLAKSRELLAAGELAAARTEASTAAHFGLAEVEAEMKRFSASLDAAEAAARSSRFAAARKAFSAFLPRFRKMLAARHYARARDALNRELARLRQLAPQLPEDVSAGMRAEREDLRTCEAVFETIGTRLKRLSAAGGRLLLHLPSPLDGHQAAGRFERYDPGNRIVYLRKGDHVLPFPLAGCGCEKVLELAGLSWSASREEDRRRIAVFVLRDGKATDREKIIARGIAEAIAADGGFDAERYVQPRQRVATPEPHPRRDPGH